MSKESEQLRADWFGQLSDESKADVIKVKIAEEEKTARSRIENEHRTKQNLIQTDGYHVVRFTFVVFLLAIVYGASCVAYRKIELDHGVDVPHVSSPAIPHPPPASSVQQKQ
jgi:hypothetical protein